MKEDYPGQHLWEIISSAGLGVSICEMSHSSSLFIETNAIFHT